MYINFFFCGYFFIHIFIRKAVFLNMVPSLLNFLIWYILAVSDVKSYDYKLSTGKSQSHFSYFVI